MKIKTQHPLLISKGRKPRTGVVKVCVCGKEFYRSPSHLRFVTYFCSRSCRKKDGKPVSLTCKICSTPYTTHASQIKHRGSSYCSLACRAKSQTVFYSGENSPTWQGGISSESKRIRASKEWADWRTEVFERDDYTCQECHKRGGYLEPHHLLRFSQYPAHRFLLSNGQTLCRDCHQLTKKYDKKPLRLEDFVVFYAQN